MMDLSEAGDRPWAAGVRRVRRPKQSKEQDYLLSMAEVPSQLGVGGRGSGMGVVVVVSVRVSRSSWGFARERQGSDRISHHVLSQAPAARSLA